MTIDARAQWTPEEWQRVERVFDVAVSLSGPERLDYLEQSCSGDAALRRDVERMLAAVDASDGALTQPALERFDKLLPDDAAMPAIIADRYVIRDILGRGGMATVYRASDPKTGRDVAVKILHEHLAPTLGRGRFVREVRIVANLAHPRIVPLFDAGESGELLYYVMPVITGGSLRQRLAAHAPLDSADCVRILRDVATALAFAHAQGIVHRDIKPDNVLFDAEDRAMVSDFGVARAWSTATATPQSSSATHTAAGFGLGTPAYMSPEQATGDAEVDHRADIYSFGAMAYEMCSGRTPFDGRPAHQMLAAHVHETPTPLTSLSPGVTPALAALIMRCLEKSVEARPATAAALIAELEDLPESANRATGTAPQPAATALPRDDVRGGTPSTVLTRRALAIAGVGAVLAVAAFGAQRMRARRDQPTAGSLLAAAAPNRRLPLVVADFSAANGDSTLASAFADAARASLWQSTALAPLSASRVASVLTRMGLNPKAALSETVAREVAVREGAIGVVRGSVSATSANGYLLALQIVSPDSARVLA